MSKFIMREEAYKRLKDRLMNEISYDKVNKAYDVSDDIFSKMSSTFADFYHTVKFNADETNPYVQRIKAYADKIKELIDKKYDQGRLFYDETGKVDINKARKDDDKYGEDEIRDLQARYPRKP